MGGEMWGGRMFRTPLNVGVLNGCEFRNPGSEVVGGKVTASSSKLQSPKISKEIIFKCAKKPKSSKDIIFK